MDNTEKSGVLMFKFRIGLLVLGLALCAAGGELFYCLQPQGKRQNFPRRTAGLGRTHIVIDCSFDGSDEERWTRDELRQFKSRGATVLCYFSIGEAENYRGYWQTRWKNDPPPFLLTENPRWKGNFRVRYWDAAWQKIMLAELDRIVEAGFDGVFLDIVDGFEYFEAEARREQAVNPATGRTYRADMVQWVIRLAERARKRKADFRIFIQNGEALLADSALLRTIDGLVVEDLFSNGKSMQSSAEIRERLRYIHLAQSGGKTCFAVEYLPAGRKKQIQEQAARFHLDLLVTDRDLKSEGKTYPVKPSGHSSSRADHRRQ